MHRSGTSALARVTSLLGADLPNTLMGGNPANLASNTTGHWESERIARLNDAILDAAGTDWRSPESVNTAWYETPRYSAFREQALTTLTEEFGQSPLFVLKDPRACKLASFWVSVLEEAGISPKVVSIYRSPREVSASLLKRNEIDRSLGELMWLRYVLDAESASRSVARSHVTYEGLLNDWQVPMARIRSDLDIQWSRSSSRTENEIARFLTAEGRHHIDELTGKSLPGVSGWLVQTYQIFRTWAEVKEDRADWPVLDRIRADLDKLLETMGRPVLLAFEQAGALRKLRRIRSNLEADVKQLKALAETTARSSEAEIVMLREKITALDREKVQIELRSEQWRESMAQLRTELVTTLLRREEEERARVEADLTSLRGRLEAAGEELARTRFELSAALSKGQRVDEELAKTVLDLGELRGKMEATHEELARTRSELLTAVNENDQLSQDLAGAARARAELEVLGEEARRHHEVALAEIRGKLEAVSQDAAQTRTQLHRERAARTKTEAALSGLEKDYSEHRRIAALEIHWLSQRDKKAHGALLSHIVRALKLHAVPWQSAARKKLLQQIAAIEDSGLFDAEFYLEKYPDVRESGVEPVRHYLTLGGLEGRAASPLFDGAWYLSRHPDVRKAELNPLLHYIEHRKREERDQRVDGRPPVVAEATITPRAEASVPARAREVGNIETVPPPQMDIESDWRARPVNFLRKKDSNTRWLKLADIRVIDGECELSLGELRLAKLATSKTAELVRELAALSYLAMIPGAPKSGPVVLGNREFPALGSPGEVRNAALRLVLCGQAVSLCDVWSVNDFGLRLRLQINAAPRRAAFVMRLFQCDEQGTLALCGEAAFQQAGPGIMAVALADPFRPVLLVLTEGDGEFLDSALIAFPSACRNGLHHGELVAAFPDVDTMAGLRSYSIDLLEGVPTSAGSNTEYAISEIEVNLRNANGGEPIFGAALGRWLRHDLGLGISMVADPAAVPQVHASLAAAGAGPAAGTARGASGTLVIPADAVPSLRILFAGRTSVKTALATCLVDVERDTRRARYELRMPANIPEMDILRPVSFAILPHVQARTDGAAHLMSSADAPLLAVRFIGAAKSDSRALFPVSADLPLAGADANALSARQLSVVINCHGDRASVSATLHSLSRQTGGFNLDCILVGNEMAFLDGAPVPDSAQPIPLRELVLPDASSAARIAEGIRIARAERILLLDDDIVLHDARTIAVLWSLCDVTGVGSTGCTLVQERTTSKEQISYSRSAGYFPQRAGGVASHLSFAQIDVSDVALPAVLAVAALPLKCLMIDKSLWCEQVGDVEGQASAIDLGLGLIRAGYRNICTAIVAATDTGSLRAGSISDPDAPHVVGIDEVDALLAKVSVFRRLGR